MIASARTVLHAKVRRGLTPASYTRGLGPPLPHTHAKARPYPSSHGPSALGAHGRCRPSMFTRSPMSAAKWWRSSIRQTRHRRRPRPWAPPVQRVRDAPRGSPRAFACVESNAALGVAADARSGSAGGAKPGFFGKLFKGSAPAQAGAGPGPSVPHSAAAHAPSAEPVGYEAEVRLPPCALAVVRQCCSEKGWRGMRRTPCRATDNIQHDTPPQPATDTCTDDRQRTPPCDEQLYN